MICTQQYLFNEAKISSKTGVYCSRSSHWRRKLISLAHFSLHLWCPQLPFLSSSSQAPHDMQCLLSICSQLPYLFSAMLCALGSWAPRTASLGLPDWLISIWVRIKGLRREKLRYFFCVPPVLYPDIPWWQVPSGGSSFRGQVSLGSGNALSSFASSQLEVGMSVCCCWSLSVSSSLVCSLNPAHTSVSSLLIKISSFVPCGVHSFYRHDPEW